MAVSHELATTLKAKFFRGLADPSQLLIVDVLRDGEKTVSQIVEETGLSQPNTSTHLACLQDCGLVQSPSIRSLCLLQFGKLTYVRCDERGRRHLERSW